MNRNGETFMDWYSSTRDYPRWQAEIAVMEERPRWHNQRFPEFEAEVSRRTKMDILLHKYRQQGRPQAHLDRVMRLGRKSPEEVRKKWEALMRKGVLQNWSSYV